MPGLCQWGPRARTANRPPLFLSQSRQPASWACAGWQGGVTLPDVGERQDGNNAGKVPERVTIAEAATLLGCHPNTVRSRVKAGMYSAEKVVTERGPTWMIDRNSLTTSAPTSAPQQGVGVVPEVQSEALQELARLIVREAGIVQDPEQVAVLENDKARAEFFRTLLLLHVALVTGLAAVATFAADLQAVWPMSAALVITIVSITAGLLGLSLSTFVVGTGKDWSEKLWGLPVRECRDLSMVVTVALFGSALLLFIIFVGGNIAL